jgi:hypothetical protein
LFLCVGVYKQVNSFDYYRGLMPFIYHNHYSLMTAMLAGRKKIDPLEGIDIEKEYGLIQQKKSALSRNMRDMVVFRYERDRGE